MMASGDGTFSVMQAQSSGVSSEATSMLANFWTNVMNDMRHIKDDQLKQQELPLARIKKIMKLDEDVKMISAEAPVLFAKAAEVFVSELSLRAWIHTEENKRRTLQRNDIAMAITKFDQFDFLIDIVPREELKPTKRTEEVRTTSVLPDQIQYFLQLAQQQAQQQHQQQQQQQQQKQQQVIVTSSAAQPQAAPVQHTVAVSQPGQQIGQPFQIIGQPGVVTSLVSNAGSTVNVPTATLAGQPQVITIQAPQVQHTTQQVQQPVQQIQHVQQAPPTQPQQQQTQQTQVFQQVITASGEVQNIPIQLTQAQLQAIQMQLQGKHTNQPIIIQTSGAQSMQTDQVNQFAQSTVYQVQQLAAGGGQQVYIQQAGGDHEQTGDGAQS